MSNATAEQDDLKGRAAQLLTAIEQQIGAHNQSVRGQAEQTQRLYNALNVRSERLRQQIEAASGQARVELEDAYMDCIRRRAQAQKLLLLARSLPIRGGANYAGNRAAQSNGQ